jgi:hypothetical protein
MTCFCRHNHTSSSLMLLQFLRRKELLTVKNGRDDEQNNIVYNNKRPPPPLSSPFDSLFQATLVNESSLSAEPGAAAIATSSYTIKDVGACIIYAHCLDSAAGNVCILAPNDACVCAEAVGEDCSTNQQQQGRGRFAVELVPSRVNNNTNENYGISILLYRQRQQSECVVHTRPGRARKPR